MTFTSILAAAALAATVHAGPYAIGSPVVHVPAHGTAFERIDVSGLPACARDVVVYAEPDDGSYQDWTPAGHRIAPHIWRTHLPFTHYDEAGEWSVVSTVYLCHGHIRQLGTPVDARFRVVIPGQSS